MDLRPKMVAMDGELMMIMMRTMMMMMMILGPEKRVDGAETNMQKA